MLCIWPKHALTPPSKSSNFQLLSKTFNRSFSSKISICHMSKASLGVNLLFFFFSCGMPSILWKGDAKRLRLCKTEGKQCKMSPMWLKKKLNVLLCSVFASHGEMKEARRCMPVRYSWASNLYILTGGWFSLDNLGSKWNVIFGIGRISLYLRSSSGCHLFLHYLSSYWSDNINKLRGVCNSVPSIGEATPGVYGQFWALIQGRHGPTGRSPL